MKDFVETKKSNYTALPMKDRIKLIQTQNLLGKKQKMPIEH